MLMTDVNTIEVEKRLHIKRLFEWDERLAIDIFIPNEEEYEILVLKKTMRQKDTYVFAGYLDDIAIVTIYFQVMPNSCTRFHYIITANDYQKNGYAREILSYAVDYCMEHSLPNCFLWPAHETSRRLCFEAGFRDLFEAEAGEAVYRI